MECDQEKRGVTQSMVSNESLWARQRWLFQWGENRGYLNKEALPPAFVKCIHFIY